MLLGLLAEEPANFNGTSLELETARGLVQKTGRRTRPVDNAREIPFSRNAKSIFEGALQV